MTAGEATGAAGKKLLAIGCGDAGRDGAGTAGDSGVVIEDNDPVAGAPEARSPTGNGEMAVGPETSTTEDVATIQADEAIQQPIENVPQAP